MKKLILTSLCVLFFAGTALADWNVGDPNKWVQLPDPYGWDVSWNFSSQTLADDFLCTQNGPITDIHFWVSWQGDVAGSIAGMYAYIYGDLSKEPLWSSTFLPGQFTMKYAGSGLQGWDLPAPNSECIYDDHQTYYQVNIEDIADSYTQQAGQTYWLVLSLWMADGQVGWKTTSDNDSWGSSAMYWAYHPIEGDGYYYSLDPIAVCSENKPVDMAFVITPEPTTVALLGLGALSLIRKKRA